jgi:hypothetical protein
MSKYYRLSLLVALVALTVAVQPGVTDPLGPQTATADVNAGGQTTESAGSVDVVELSAPERSRIGTDVRVEAVAENDGDEPVTRSVQFVLGGSRYARKEVRLDPGPGAIVRDDQLVCHEHAARFDCADGVCTAGPCQGDALEEIAVAVRDGDVYLTDDRFDSCRRLDDATE